MKSGVSSFAVVTGISMGIFNVMIGLNVLMGALVMQALVPSAGVMAVALAMLIVAGVNLAGGIVCRVNRTAGGIMLLLTASPLLMTGVAFVCVSLLMPGLTSEMLGTANSDTAMRAALGVGILMLVIELASGAAAVVSLAARQKIEPASVENIAPEQAVECFAQKYAARLRQ